MNTATSILQAISIVSIGLLVGALLTEACLLVPYWRSLQADRFHEHYRDLHPRLYRYFTPLTAASLIASLACAGASIAANHRNLVMTVVAGLLMVSVVATHEVYFKKANTQFAQGALREDDLSAELARWSMWNWARIGLASMALVASIVGFHAG